MEGLKGMKFLLFLIDVLESASLSKEETGKRIFVLSGTRMVTWDGGEASLLQSELRLKGREAV